MANGYVGDARIDVKNKGAQHATINWDGGKLNAHIGGTKAVGDGEFRDLIGGKLNVNKRDNDIADILMELTTGKTGGNGKEDTDKEIGIDGVQLISLTNDSFTIALENGSGVVDTLTFQGAGVEALIAALGGDQDTFAALGVDDPGGALAKIQDDAGDPRVNFKDKGKLVVDEGEKSLSLGNFDFVKDLEFDGVVVGSSISSGAKGVNDRAAILEAALDPSEDRIQLLGLEADNFSVQIQYGSQIETIVFKGASAEAAIAAVTSGDKVRPENDTNEAVIIDAAYGGNQGIPGGDDPVEDFTGLNVGGNFTARDANGAEGPGGSVAGKDDDVVLRVNEIENLVAVVDQGDTVRIEFIDDKGTADTSDDTRDVLVVPDDPGNDITPGGAANDLLDYNNMDVA